jgi:hypothetical protein
MHRIPVAGGRITVLVRSHIVKAAHRPDMRRSPTLNRPEGIFAEGIMRFAWVVLLAPLALAACGSDTRPVVVQAPAGSVVAVPGNTHQPVEVVPTR